jgi:hypothetical protein
MVSMVFKQVNSCAVLFLNYLFGNWGYEYRRKIMKKIIFFVTVLFVAIGSLNAQTDFYQLINSINWENTESEILQKYSTIVKPRKHFYSNYDKTITDYEFENIVLDKYNCTASIFVDSVSKKIHSLSFSFGDQFEGINAKTISQEMDTILFSLFGEPDKRIDKHKQVLDRTWYKGKYIVKVLHMVFSDSHFYSMTIKGIKDKGNDFRVAKWGDSKEIVIQKEGKENSSSSDRIYLFSDFVAGMSCDVAYIFTNDKLTMAKYIFNPNHTNTNDYISDFRNLVNLMTEKYGEPKYNAPEWKKSLYKKDLDKYGLAISLGHLSYSAGWSEETTQITVALYGENYEVTLMIQYVSEKYKNLKQKYDINEKIKDL